jgi:hypothetical protein
MNSTEMVAAEIKDSNKAVKALREARKIVKDGPVDLYRFENGKWSWAVPTSPIGQQLRADGHVYPTVRASKWFTVGA